MRALCLVLLGLPALLVQGQYSRFEGITYPEPVQYSQYDQQAEIQDYYDYHDVTPRTPEEQFRYQSQQQSQQEIVPAPTPAAAPETEPTEPGPLDCREEQYPCTRLYSVHKPCKQCLNEICFYSLRRVYVINKEICVRTVCAHEELLRGKGREGNVSPTHLVDVPSGWLRLDGEEDADISDSSVHRSTTSHSQYRPVWGGRGRQHRGVPTPGCSLIFASPQPTCAVTSSPSAA
uniref:Microfibril associated protein 2 n=1 Tax=Anser brachyrhynchus TaxID=132585 RepID=A0A8B9B9L3_9AVES